MGTLALIGLGSNVGDRRSHLDRAVAALAETRGVAVRAVSTYHETAPAGGPAGQEAFLNAAARLDTDLDPLALLHVLLDIEARAGRVRTVRWGERPLDLDLLIYGCKSLQTPELTLPHPRLGVRRFVLAPLAEIAPEIVDMRSGLTIGRLLAGLDRRPSFVALDGPPGPFRDAIYDGIVAELPAVGLAEFTIPPGEGPDWLEADAQLASLLPPRIKAKIRSIEARRWREAIGDWGWLVTDFCLTGRSLWHLDAGTDAADVDIYSLHQLSRAPYKIQGQIHRWFMPQTFIVGLPGGVYASRHLLRGMPFRTYEVLLTPESDDPEGIIGEVLAACAASRA
jgi:2-amino-4-hydroxy-6-hydroxymethyldihydropteridine diphosphokinase